MDALTSIQHQTWGDWELIVIGQGSDMAVRDMVEAVASRDERVRYVHVPRPGLSRARNRGIAAAKGEIVAMMDDDCEADAKWLATIAGCFVAEPEVGLIGGALVPPVGAVRRLSSCPALIPAERLYDPVATGRHAPEGWDWIGGNFAVRRSIAERVGRFDEYLGAGTRFPSGEDTDYKLRMEALGIKMRSTPRAVVHHTHGVRYGLRAGLRHSRNYARGNGALAGKLTLMGDPRGREWLTMATRESSRDWLSIRTAGRMPVSLLRLRHFRQAYDECRRAYRVDPALQLLEPIVPES